MRTFVEFITEAELPHFQSAEEVNQHVAKHYPGVDFDFYDKPHPHNSAKVHMIRVPKNQQKQGIGSNIMRAVAHYADRNGKTVLLSPASETERGQPRKTKLIRWYREFGFVPNKGRNKDYRYQETMIRRPNTPKGT